MIRGPNPHVLEIATGTTDNVEAKRGCNISFIARSDRKVGGLKICAQGASNLEMAIYVES